LNMSVLVASTIDRRRQRSHTTEQNAYLIVIECHACNASIAIGTRQNI
jgi:hypothetical protein